MVFTSTELDDYIMEKAELIQDMILVDEETAYATISVEDIVYELENVWAAAFEQGKEVGRIEREEA